MFGKARVDPIELMMILKIELHVTVYDAQLAQFDKKEMNIEIQEIVFFLISRQFYTGTSSLLDNTVKKKYQKISKKGNLAHPIF